MKTSPVRGDAKGIFVITNGGKYRPGNVAGYDHVYRMDDAGLKIGDRVIVKNIACSPLCHVLIPNKDGSRTKLVWHVYDYTTP